MGADMILAACEIPLDYEKMRPIVLKRIDELDDDLVDHIVDCFYDIELELEEYSENISETLTENDLFKLDNLVSIKKREVVARRITEAADDLFGPSYSRDVVEMFLGDRYYLFSGGMSWGEEPTESYEQVVLVCDSGVTKGLGKKEALNLLEKE